MKLDSAVPTVAGGASPASIVTIAEGSFGMACGEGERNDATHAVADHGRPLEAELLAEKGEIVGEKLHGVGLLRLVALPVSA